MNTYIHIPFCRQKCPYCKFALTPIFDAAKKRRYLAHLENEIRTYFSQSSQKSCKTDTIYFGGGTPSILSLEEVSTIIDCFPNRDNSEISFECNPEDISTDYVYGLFELGVNRLSLGIQSLNNSTLQAIHRSDRENIMKALGDIEDALFLRKKKPSINIDFILGLPFSKPGETLADIQALHKIFPYITHTSVYMLEAGLYPREWGKDSISEGMMRDEYSAICTYFDSLDWNHYEISNWSKGGYTCTHNQGYWNHTTYQGFGLSATSYLDGKRWENSHAFSRYYDTGSYENEEILTDTQKALEAIIFSIRTFSLDAQLFSREILDKLKEERCITICAGKIHLTPTGIFRENTIISELIADSPP